MDQPITKKPKKRRIGRKLLIVLVSLVIIVFAHYEYSYVYKSNFKEVVEDTVYRSAQPRMNQLSKWIENYQIKTIINLRGDAGDITDQEENLAKSNNITFITLKFSAYEYPTKKNLIKLIETIETCNKPLLLHCRQGMDRSGTASAIAAMAVGKESYKQALWESFIPPGPWKRKASKHYIHISDLFDLYEDYCQEHSLNPDSWDQFKDWAIHHYQVPNNTKHLSTQNGQ